MGKYFYGQRFKLRTNISFDELENSIFSLDNEENRVFQLPMNRNRFEIRSIKALWWMSPPSSRYLIDMELRKLPDNIEIDANIKGNWILNSLSIFFLIIIPIWTVGMLKIGEDRMMVIGTAALNIGLVMFFIYSNLKLRDEGIEVFTRLKERIEEIDI